MTKRNIIHDIFPAEKRLAKIDQLEIELDRRKNELPITEYVRAKRALTIKRLTEFRRIERANNWDPGKFEDIDDTGESPGESIENEIPSQEPETPLYKRLIHYAIFWGWLVLLSWVVCLISEALKK